MVLLLVPFINRFWLILQHSITGFRYTAYLTLLTPLSIRFFSSLLIYNYIGKKEGVEYALNMARGVKRKYVRSTLNSNQISLLELVYKYRFVSRQLVAESLGIAYGSSLHERLEVLVKNKYLARRYDKRNRLQGIPAAYYITPQGLRTLQALPGHATVTDVTIKSSYIDKTVGMDFVIHVLNVHKYTNLLKRHYPDLKIFTKRDIARYSYFPPTLPDAVLSLPVDDPKQPKRFFFDLVSDSTPRSSLDRRIATYCDFFDDGGWDIIGSELPTILLLSERGVAERSVQRRVLAQLNRSDMEELPTYTSTAAALERISGEGLIWTSVEDTEDLQELGQLS
jgi:hypothetical protein